MIRDILVCIVNLIWNQLGILLVKGSNFLAKQRKEQTRKMIIITIEKDRKSVESIEKKFKTKEKF